MAVAAKKPKQTAPETQPEERIMPGEVVGDDVQVRAAAAKTSPAKAMQDRLLLHYSPVSRHMSSRFVTLLVTVTCIGMWFAGTGLYTSV